MMTNPKRLTEVLIGTLLVLSLQTGCVRLKKEYLEKRYFVLDVARPGAPVSAVPGTILAVHRFRVSPLYDSKAFAYRKKGLNYESDFYNEFLISPGSLITEQVRRWLADSGVFEHVVDSPSRAAPTHVLEGSVASLFGDLSDPTQPKAILEIQFFLLQETTSRPRIAFHKSYRKTVPIARTAPDALVNGWNKALAQILSDFVTDLRKNAFTQQP